jgi:50S ribosomal protein L16 3-hydroxylase
MLYLPPGWAHDGVAVGGDCMTASIGFRAPGEHELVQALLGLLADREGSSRRAAARYRDPRQAATPTPGLVPGALQAFARDAVRRALAQPHALERALGEWLTEPKPQVWFDAAHESMRWAAGALRLDRRTRMSHDAGHVYINGEAHEARGAGARLLRRLADERALSASDVARLDPRARDRLADWLAAGWVHSTGDANEP